MIHRTFAFPHLNSLPTHTIPLTFICATRYLRGFRLKLPPGTPNNDIRSVYRRVMRFLHPDKTANIADAYERALKELVFAALGEMYERMNEEEEEDKEDDGDW